MTKLKKGDRVKYTSGKWLDRPSNPLWGGSQGEIKGTIVIENHNSKMANNSFAFTVKWDNENQAMYEENDLELVKDTIEETIIKLTK